jgi:arabinose-5-phosphate isomerase
MDTEKIIAVAKRTIQLEAESVAALQLAIDEQFVEAVQQIIQSKGRVVVSGIGKSAIIAQKIVATFNSTGTPGLYMHAADAIHGDLGMVQPDDVVMVISKSGNSPEIKVLVPLIKRFGNPIIGMVGNMESYLAKNATIVLNTTVSQEACPNNLAPTTSTTAQLAMGDALAVSLMQVRGFTGADFARFHPGGTLGKKLYLTVADLISGNPRPAVAPTTPLPETVIEMTSKLLGATAVINPDGTVYGIITDGDLRRMLVRRQPIAGIKASDICSTNPYTISPDTLAVEALDQMRKHDITHLLVTQGGQYLGILHLHDLVREGLI